MSPLNSPPMRLRLKDRKRNKKRGGFFWFWNKVRGLFGLAEEGAGGLGASSSGAAASAASRVASEAIEAGEGLGRVSVLSPGVGGAASQSSIWLGRAVMAALGVGVVAVGVIGISKALSSSNPSSKTSPHFGPIASLIHIFRPGYGKGPSQASSPSSASGASESSLSNKTAEGAAAQNGGKAQGASVAQKSGRTAVFPGAFKGLASAKLSTDLNDGSPLSAAAPKEAGQAAQEAAMVKNGSFSANNQIAVTAMSAAPMSPYLAAGVAVGTRGRGFSRSFGGLRGMSEYVHPMGTSAGTCAGGDSSCDSAAGNAINQWENAPIVGSGQGISMGGANAGTADNPGTANPSGSGGTGGSSPGTSLAGDISNVCSSDQIQKGYVSNGSACVPGYAPGQTKATPWQNNLDMANLLIQILSGLMFAGCLLLSLFWAFLDAAEATSWSPMAGYLYSMAEFIQSHIEIVGGLMLAMAGRVIYLSTRIGAQGGHSQALMTGIVGGMLALGAGILMTDNLEINTMLAPDYMLLSLAPLATMIISMLGVGGTGGTGK